MVRTFKTTMNKKSKQTTKEETQHNKSNTSITQTKNEQSQDDTITQHTNTKYGGSHPDKTE